MFEPDTGLPAAPDAACPTRAENSGSPRNVPRKVSSALAWQPTTFSVAKTEKINKIEPCPDRAWEIILAWHGRNQVPDQVPAPDLIAAHPAIRVSRRHCLVADLVAPELRSATNGRPASGGRVIPRMRVPKGPLSDASVRRSRGRQSGNPSQPSRLDGVDPHRRTPCNSPAALARLSASTSRLSDAWTASKLPTVRRDRRSDFRVPPARRPDRAGSRRTGRTTHRSAAMHNRFTLP